MVVFNYFQNIFKKCLNQFEMGLEWYHQRMERNMTKQFYNVDKHAEENGIELRLSISFFTSEDGKKMQLCSCNISNGYKSVNYAWVVGQTTLDDVIREFLDNQD